MRSRIRLGNLFLTRTSVSGLGLGLVLGLGVDPGLGFRLGTEGGLLHEELEALGLVHLQSGCGLGLGHHK